MNNVVLRDTFMFISDSSVGSLTDQHLLAIVVRSYRVGHSLFVQLHGARRRPLNNVTQNVAGSRYVRANCNESEATTKRARLVLEAIAVQLDFFCKRFFHDSPLVVVEYLLIWSAISPIFRFRPDTKRSVERNV